MRRFKNTSLILGGVFGSTAIALNAYATHVLHTRLSPHDFESLESAISYQQLHALLLVVLGLIKDDTRLIRAAQVFVTFGILLFSGSIYAAILANLHAPIPLAPAGGISFMIGWIMLALSGLGKHHAND